MSENNELIKIFRCNICNKKYSSQSSLCNHNKKFHNNISQHNNNITQPKNNISQHNNNIQQHNNNLIESNFICKYCSKIYKHQQSKSRHEKNCNQKNNDKLDKKFEDFKNTILDIIQKEAKIHPKTLQKINNDITSDNSIKFLNNDTSKIIKSDDNKFEFDISKNFLLFHDKPIKYFFYNDQVYFKGKDVASMLEYNDTDHAIRKNVDNEDTIIIGELLENEDPQTVFINESGFYTIIFASKKSEAIKFRRWVTNIVLPSIRKNGSYNLIDNYIEEDLDKYYNKDCVYIIHIKDNIYKYGNTSHIFKRLQAHKTNLNYNKIIKIYEMNNINEAINLEKKIKTLVKSLKINKVYNTHVEIFEVDNNNLHNLIEKIDVFSLKTIKIKNDNIKQLELENENLKLKLELLKYSK